MHFSTWILWWRCRQIVLRWWCCLIFKCVIDTSYVILRWYKLRVDWDLAESSLPVYLPHLYNCVKNLNHALICHAPTNVSMACLLPSHLICKHFWNRHQVLPGPHEHACEILKCHGHLFLFCEPNDQILYFSSHLYFLIPPGLKYYSDMNFEVA